MKHSAEIAAFVKAGDYVTTNEGVLIHGSILARGMYVHTVNGEDEQFDSNLVVTEGLNYFLTAGLTGGGQATTWYLAPYFANATPLSTWTASNFATNSGETASNTEGYSETVRQTWTPGSVASGAVDNYAARAEFTIATATTVTIYGAGLLSSPTKAGTAGVLASATKFASARQLSAGDTFQLGYQVQLTDS